MTLEIHYISRKIYDEYLLEAIDETYGSTTVERKGRTKEFKAYGRDKARVEQALIAQALAYTSEDRHWTETIEV